MATCHVACLGNPMDRGAWWATVNGVTKRASEDLATEHTYWLKACELVLDKNTQCSPLGKHAQQEIGICLMMLRCYFFSFTVFILSLLKFGECEEHFFRN